MPCAARNRPPSDRRTRSIARLRPRTSRCTNRSGSSKRPATRQWLVAEVVREVGLAGRPLVAARPREGEAGRVPHEVERAALHLLVDTREIDAHDAEHAQ